MVQIHRPPPSQKPNPAFTLLAKGSHLLRLYSINSPYPYTLFRHFGPFERYDHHRVTYHWNSQADPDRAVCYCAQELSACIVEVCGDKQIIESYYKIITIEATHPISLLDLRANAAMRAGTPVAISAIPDRIYTQEWAQYFYLETPIYGPNTGGIIYSSAHNGEDCIVLWDRAISSVREIGQEDIIKREKEVRQIAQDNNVTVVF